MALPDYPITRNEQYLSRIAGEDHPIPDYPITREEQYLAAIAEGGGGWPADLPKPSVGGYGYTEQGEQTVITWDGDISGLVSVQLNERINFYKISDLIVPNSDIVGMSVAWSHGLTVTITQPIYEELVEMGLISDDISAFEEGMAVFARQNGASLFGRTFPETGVYFMKDRENFVSSLTYGTPDTIHKIDEKYLPEGGGGVTTLHIHVSAVDLETLEPTFTADKTVDEMQNCFTPTWCVVTFAPGIMSEDEEVSLGIPPVWNGGDPCFGSVVLPAHNGDGNNEYVAAVTGVGDNWILDLRAFGA